VKKISAAIASTIAIAAFAAASPAAATYVSAISPNLRAQAWTNGTALKASTTVTVYQMKSGYSHGDYYRAASSSTQRHLWNKSGTGTLVTSGTGSDIFKLRVCEWVPDNDDKCSGWDT
jgi:hypothetical protein